LNKDQDNPQLIFESINSTGLDLSQADLNMPFRELRDPESRARDVTNVGYWGRGDVEVSLSSFDELPYVLSLIRQAFERQIPSADAEAYLVGRLA
jgi:predicted transport protein